VEELGFDSPSLDVAKPRIRAKTCDLSIMELHDRLFVAKEIGEAFAYFRVRFSMELRENGLRAIQHLEEEEVKAIQQSVLNGTYALSPSRIFSFEREGIRFKRDSHTL